MKLYHLGFEAFDWIWENNKAIYSSEFILLLCQLSTDIREPASLADMSMKHLHNLLFPSLWYKLILDTSVDRMFQNYTDFFLTVLYTL